MNTQPALQVLRRRRRVTPFSRQEPTWQQKLGLMVLAGVIILASGGTLGLAFNVGMGVMTVFGSVRSQFYEEQTTGVPIEQSYIVNGTEFDGFDGFSLVDAKGPGYDPLIKGDWSDEPKSTYKTAPVTGEVKRVKKGLIEIAEDQVEAVRATGTDTPIQWHIAERYTFDHLQFLQERGRFPIDVELIYTPPN